MKYTYTKTRELRPSDIYLGPAIVIPKNYVITDFRPPRRGEATLCDLTGQLYFVSEDYDVDNPRFILTKVFDISDVWE